MCGIIGIYGKDNVVQEIFDSLIMVQHRGQDAAGIMTYDEKTGQFCMKKGDGLVREVFHTKNMIRLKGSLGIGHVRYPTAGIYESAEAQPFFVNSPFGIALVHNGNLTNYRELKKELLETNIRHLNTYSDSEVLLNVLADEILRLRTVNLTKTQLFKAMAKVYDRLKGGYSAVAVIGDKGMLGFRDPHGIRPLVLGVRKSSFKTEYIFASETVALDCLGFEYLRDVKPGEVVFIDKNRQLHSKLCTKSVYNPCIFEYIYLARPDSVMDKVNVYKARLRLGEKLAKQIKKAKLKIDVVIPVPDTSRSAALPLAQALGVRYREGLVKNRYIGRTFIMPGQGIRKKSIRQKLNPVELEIKGKNVLLVDDSIVRGNTSRQIIRLVRSAGAKKVYFASSAAPLKHPCVYGVDMPSRSDFVANNLSVPEIAKAIEADGLFYQTVENMVAAVNEGNVKIKKPCTACFAGEYPTSSVTEAFLARVEKLREIEKIKGAVEDGEIKGDQLTLL